jgi:hypothetical protein
MREVGRRSLMQVAAAIAAGGVIPYGSRAAGALTAVSGR